MQTLREQPVALPRSEPRRLHVGDDERAPLGQRLGARGVAGEVQDAALVPLQEATGSGAHHTAIAVAIGLVDVAVSRSHGAEKAGGHGAQELLHIVRPGDELRKVEELLEHAVASLDRSQKQRLLQSSGHHMGGAARVLEGRRERSRPLAVQLDDAHDAALRQQRDAQLAGKAVLVVHLAVLVAETRIVAVLHVDRSAGRERLAHHRPDVGPQDRPHGLFVRAATVQTDEAAKHAFVFEPVDVAGHGAGGRQHEAGDVAQQFRRVVPASGRLSEVREGAQDLALAFVSVATRAQQTVACETLEGGPLEAPMAARTAPASDHARVAGATHRSCAHAQLGRSLGHAQEP